MSIDDTIRHPYQDPSLPVDQRVGDLLARMDDADKAGLMFHTIATTGDPERPGEPFGTTPLATMIRQHRMNHFNILGAAPTGREFAAWTNAVQRLALEQPLGIPVTFSTDPRHSFTDNPGASMLAGPFSQWPETTGLAAIGSPDRVRRHGEIVRQEYTAVGIRVALHPQIDLSTEPRWSRINSTFGEDADLTSKLVEAYIQGLHGDTFGPGSVSTVVKHFPGGGPQKDGEDPHFPTGREQVYPGGRFEYHLQPFIAAIRAGARQMMPYYGMPVGTEYEEVGFGFNRSVITDILRERLGFDGIVCTDWGLLTDTTFMGVSMVARAWGVEGLTREERMLKALDAGVDQFGGEMCTGVLVKLMHDGRVTRDRIDASARRILREKFALGLFDSPFVDEDRAEAVVGNSEFVREGRDAQSDALTLLTNVDEALPLTEGLKVYSEGIDRNHLRGYATPVESVDEADVAVLRVKAPFEQRSGGLAAFFHAGSLAFPDDERERLGAIAARVPTVIDIYLDRPAVLGGLEDAAAAVVADFGASDEAILDVLFGRRSPHGRLPFDLPRSMDAVAASRSDVPFDTADPTFRFGHGLSYPDA